MLADAIANESLPVRAVQHPSPPMSREPSPPMSRETSPLNDEVSATFVGATDSLRRKSNDKLQLQPIQNVSRQLSSEASPLYDEPDPFLRHIAKRTLPPLGSTTNALSDERAQDSLQFSGDSAMCPQGAPSKQSGLDSTSRENLDVQRIPRPPEGPRSGPSRPMSAARSSGLAPVSENDILESERLPPLPCWASGPDVDAQIHVSDASANCRSAFKQSFDEFKGLDGSWLTTTGEWRTVTLGWLAGQPLEVNQGTISCDSWNVISRTKESICWKKDSVIEESEEWRRPTPAALEGPWHCLQDGWSNVVHGFVNSEPLMFSEGHFKLAGWTTSIITHSKVTWTLHGDIKSWHRPNPGVLDGCWITPKGMFHKIKHATLDGVQIDADHHGHIMWGTWHVLSVSDTEVLMRSKEGLEEKWNRPDPKSLDGAWMSSPGGWRNVVNGMVDCQAIVQDKGILRLDRWLMTSMTERSITWEDLGETVIWHRATPDLISGPWLTSKGQIRNIIHGCVDGTLMDQTGVTLSINGWQIHAIFEEWMLLKSADGKDEEEWRRPPIALLEGAWISSMTGWRNVVDGYVDGGQRMFAVKGIPTFDVWTATAMTSDSITWEHSGETITWQRPRTEAIEGPWLSKGAFRNIRQGCLDGSPVELKYGRLSWNGWITSEISSSRLALRNEEGEEEIWTRPDYSLLDGTWKADEQTWMSVRNGQLPDGPILEKKGRLVYNEQVLAALDGDTAVWEVSVPGCPTQAIVWRRPSADDLEGPWLDDYGQWHNIVNGESFDPFVQRNSQEKLARESGQMCLAGWQAVSITESSITWQVTTDSRTWRRPLPSTIKGPWRSSEGCWRNVIDGRVMDFDIIMDKGRLMHAGWIVSFLNDSQIVFNRRDEIRTWTRLWPEDLNGPWTEEESMDGSKEWINIMDGRSKDASINFLDGALVFDGWSLHSADNNSLTWLNLTTLQVKRWRCLRPADIEGPWFSTEFGWLSTTDGYVRDAGGVLKDVPVDVHGWCLIVNGWVAVKAVSDCTEWHRDGETQLWHRPKPEAINGSWLTPRGDYRTVCEGSLDDAPIEVRSGRIFYRGFEVMRFNDEQLVWRRDAGEEEVWTRPTPTVLEGPWICQQRGWRNVVNGSVEGKPIVLNRGVLRFDSWQMVGMSDRTVSWDSCAGMAKWHRPQAVSLDGPWLTASGSNCNVKQGTVDGDTIVEERGRLMVHDWKASIIFDDRVQWKSNDGKTHDWIRPQPHHLDGPWNVDGRTWITVEDGALPEGPLDLQNGRLMQNSMVLSTMEKDKVVWDSPQATDPVTWWAPKATDLAGPWLSSDEGWITVLNGLVNDTEIKESNRRLVYNGWTLASLTQTSVVWVQDGFRRTWHRPKADALNGAWLTPNGYYRNIINGALDGVVLEDVGGRLSFDEREIVIISDSQMVWEAVSGSREVWIRPECKTIEGVWLSVEQGWRNVIAGAIDGSLIQQDKGVLRFDGWKMISMDEGVVVWDHFGQQVTWQRPSPNSLDGPWILHSTYYINVEDGIAAGGGKPIEKQSGNLVSGGFKAVAVYDDKIIWQDGWNEGGTKEWRRPTSQMLDGPWHVNGSTWLNVVDGCTPTGPIDTNLRSGLLCLNGMILALMDHEKIVWRCTSVSGRQEDLVWRRPAPVSFEGPWRDIGGWHNVFEGKVPDPFSQSIVFLTITHKNGRTRLNDWTCEAMTENSVSWKHEENGTTVEWHRASVEDISGPWRTSGGQVADPEWRNICQSRIGNDHITMLEGRLICAGWLLRNLTNDTLVWEHEKETMTWTRPRQHDIDGPWLDAMGLWHNVEHGTSSDDCVIRVIVGRLYYGDCHGQFVLAESTDEKLVWTKHGAKDLHWRCPISVDFDGPWVSHEHGWLAITLGRVEGQNATTLRMCQGKLMYKGWKLAAVFETAVKWKCDEKITEWHRPYSDKQALGSSQPIPPSLH